MDEPIVRLLVVLAAGAMVGLVALSRSRRLTRHGVPMTDSGLEAGIYLFISDTCGDCAVARERLDRVVGNGGYVVFAWEEVPEVFHRLDVNDVPSTMVVDDDGSALLYRGVPAKVLSTEY